MTILNLTRTSLPAATKSILENNKNIMSMPEMVLFKMQSDNPQKIVRVGMNECKTAKISPNGVNTIFTDSLASCNAVTVVSKDKSGNPIVILSHFLPSSPNQTAQASAIEKQLETYGACFDKSSKTKVFYNVPGYIGEEGLKPCISNVFGKIKKVLDKFIKNNYEEKIIPYQGKNRPAYFSSANIFQFDPQHINKCKMTTVGEQEHFFDV